MLRILPSLFFAGVVYSVAYSDTTNVADTAEIPQLDKKIVCAQLKKTELRRTPAICDVIGKEEMTSVSATDVSDALKYVPGMNIEQGTGSGVPFKKNVTINGMPNYYNLIMVDGMRLLCSHSQTGANIDMIPAAAVERVEIIKDASSALYGSDALGGVINIVTKKGTPKGEVDASVNYGSFKTWGAEAASRGTVAGGTTAYSLYAGYERSDGPDIILPAHRVGRFDYRKASFVNRFDITPSEKVGITAYCDFITDDAEFGDAKLTTEDTALIGDDGSSSTWYQVETEYDMLTAWLFTPGIDAHVDITDAFSVDLTAYYSQWVGEISSEDQEIASPRLLLTYSGFTNDVMEHEFTLGTEYLWNNYFRSGMPAQYDQHTGSGFLQYHGSFLSDRLSVLAAVRADYVRNPFEDVSNTGPVFSPKLSLLVRPVAPLSLRATFSRGFKAPSVMELYEDRFHRSYYRLGNPDLEPEYATNIAGGITYVPLPFLEVSCNGYTNLIDDMIVVIREDEDRAGRPVYKRHNLQEGRISGVEGKARLNWRWISLILGAAKVVQSSDGSLDIPYFPGTNFFSRLTFDYGVFNVVGAKAFIGYSNQLERQYWGFSSDLITKLEDLHELEAGITLKAGGFVELAFRAANLLGREHETYEDVLMKIVGEPRFDWRLNFTLR